MKSPFTGGAVVFSANEETICFRKEQFTYTHLCYKCVDTGIEFTTTEIDEVNVAQVYNQYRQKHNIPYQDEIKSMRRMYGLSAKKMSMVLGFGDNQYRLYENGEVPNNGNGKVLRAIQDPKTFLTFVELAKHLLTEQEYDAVKLSIQKSSITQAEERFKREFVFGKQERSTFNGYANQSISKLKNVILYFIEQFGGVFITQMNKLLFYSDFLSYKKYGVGLTGLQYKAIKYGPVPIRFDRVYSGLDDITQEIVQISNGNTGYKIVSELPFDNNSLTEKQRQILDIVCETFKNDTPTSISKKSHREQAWIDNIDTCSIIDYKYAFQIKEV